MTTSPRDTHRLPPIGFWSYSRQDDELSGGELSGLRSRVQRNLQQQFGRTPIKIFQDVAAISSGAKWEEEIDRALSNSAFLIPIITPNFLQSEWCCKEVALFLEKEKALNAPFPEAERRSRIFPILFIDTHEIDLVDVKVYKEIKSRQSFDYRDLRYESETPQEQRELGKFAKSVRDLLLQRMPEPPKKEEIRSDQATKPQKPTRLVRSLDRPDFDLPSDFEGTPSEPVDLKKRPLLNLKPTPKPEPTHSSKKTGRSGVQIRDYNYDFKPVVKVVGVGGAGGNIVASMIEADVDGVQFLAVNTDAQALSHSPAKEILQIGKETLNGLGAGARVELGTASAEENLDDIRKALEGVDMVCLCAGMGGGTGGGAIPVIAREAKAKGILTLAFVTKPFHFENTRRMNAAEASIAQLRDHVDAMIVLPAQNLFLIAKSDITFGQAFALADELVGTAVSALTDLMLVPGLINLDFADVKSVFEQMGTCFVGSGEAAGKNRAREAVEQALKNPLLDTASIFESRNVAIAIRGGEDLLLSEIDGATNFIRRLVNEDSNVIWGSSFDGYLNGKMRVVVFASEVTETGK